MDQLIINIIVDIIQEGFESGAFRLCDALTAATLIHGAVMGLLNSKISGIASAASFEKEVATCKELFFQGLFIQE